MYCKHCGEKIESDANFCSSCGAKVERRGFGVGSQEAISDGVRRASNFPKADLFEERNENKSRGKEAFQFATPSGFVGRSEEKSSGHINLKPFNFDWEDDDLTRGRNASKKTEFQWNDNMWDVKGSRESDSLSSGETLAIFNDHAKGFEDKPLSFTEIAKREKLAMEKEQEVQEASNSITGSVRTDNVDGAALYDYDETEAKETAPIDPMTEIESLFSNADRSEENAEDANSNIGNADKQKIDKFYTINKDREEFQEVLDQAYDELNKGEDDASRKSGFSSVLKSIRNAVVGIEEQEEEVEEKPFTMPQDHLHALRDAMNEERERLRKEREDAEKEESAVEQEVFSTPEIHPEDDADYEERSVEGGKHISTIDDEALKIKENEEAQPPRRRPTFSFRTDEAAESGVKATNQDMTWEDPTESEDDTNILKTPIDFNWDNEEDSQDKSPSSENIPKAESSEKEEDVSLEGTSETKLNFNDEENENIASDTFTGDTTDVTCDVEESGEAMEIAQLEENDEHNNITYVGEAQNVGDPQNTDEEAAEGIDQNCVKEQEEAGTDTEDTPEDDATKEDLYPDNLFNLEGVLAQEETVDLEEYEDGEVLAVAQPVVSNPVQAFPKNLLASFAINKRAAHNVANKNYRSSKYNFDYNKIFDDEEKMDADTKKGSGVMAAVKVFVYLILIVILIGIIFKFFAPDSVVSQKLDGAYDWIKQTVIGEEPENKEATSSHTTQEDWMAEASEGISSPNFTYAPDLKFIKDKEYGLEDIKTSYAFSDSIWRTDENGKDIHYGQSIIKAVVDYYARGGVIVATPDENVDSQGDIKEETPRNIASVQLGEIRTGSFGFYVLADVQSEGASDFSQEVVYVEPKNNEMIVTNKVEVQ